MFHYSFKKTRVSVSVVVRHARRAVADYFRVMQETGLGQFLENREKLQSVKLNSSRWVALLNQFELAYDHYSAMSDLKPRLDALAGKKDLIITIDSFYIDAIDIQRLLANIKLCQDMMDERMLMLSMILKKDISIFDVNAYPKPYGFMNAFDYVASKILYLPAFVFLFCVSSLLFSNQSDAAQQSDKDSIEGSAWCFLIILGAKSFADIATRFALLAMQEKLTSDRQNLFAELSMTAIENVLMQSDFPQLHPLTLSNVSGIFNRNRALAAIEAPKQNEMRELVNNLHSRSPVRPRH